MSHKCVPEGVCQVDGPPGCVLPLVLELLRPPVLDRRPPEYRVQVDRHHEEVRDVGELPLGRLEQRQRRPHAEAHRPVVLSQSLKFRNYESQHLERN